MFRALKTRFPNAIGSEYIPSVGRGHLNDDGIRCEDMTGLTFPDASFDAVLSFECLEHIPDYRAALSESRRVLKPNGFLLLTAPFDINAPHTIVRARLRPDGSIEHLMEPEYHGDPIGASDGGILSYYVFGWSLLDDLRAAGFRDAALAIYVSRTFGYFGSVQPLIIAQA